MSIFIIEHHDEDNNEWVPKDIHQSKESAERILTNGPIEDYYRIARYERQNFVPLSENLTKRHEHGAVCEQFSCEDEKIKRLLAETPDKGIKFEHWKKIDGENVLVESRTIKN